MTDDTDILLLQLPDNGLPLGNNTLRQELGWDDARFASARDALVAAGLAEKGRGRGGSLRRTGTAGKPPSAPNPAASRPTESPARPSSFVPRSIPPAPMTAQTHTELANFIWSICNLLRGPYKRNEYRKVILPLTVLRRFDCILTPTKPAALAAHAGVKLKPESVIRHTLTEITGHPFYHLSKLTFGEVAPTSGLNGLLDDPGHLAPNLNAYINAFSPNIRAIFEKFKFAEQIAKMDEKNLLFEVLKKFQSVDLSPSRVNNTQMGYVFEELIRIGAEQSNEEAGEHFTPREVIRLMVNLLLTSEKDLSRGDIIKTIYDPTCGTGGMLSVAEEYLKKLNADARPHLYGQDWNDEAWAVCKADMLIKGEDADNIILGDTFLKDGFSRRSDGAKWTFDYMLANPPFGVEWKQQQKDIEREHAALGFDGRFGAGTPRVNDGALLFLQHMLAKMRAPADGGSRLAIVFNGSPLFTGDAGSGESEIRRWIIENDWLDAVVALPEQLFYNTGIATYIWVLTNRKPEHRKGRVQLIDARRFWVPMEKSLGNKRRRLGDPADHPRDPDHIAEITKLYGDFRDGVSRDFTDEDPVTKLPVERAYPVSKIFANEDFGYRKITVERPLLDAAGHPVVATKGKDKGRPQPDAERRDTESVPLRESVETYFRREVLPHAPDAWVDEAKMKIGYEIPFNRHFYTYTPPRDLATIEREIKSLEEEIVTLLKEVTA